MLRRLRNATLLVAITATGALLYGGNAHAEPTPTPVAIEMLTPRAAFTDQASMQIRLKADGHGTDVIKVSDLSNVVTTRVTVQPGAQIPWHTHPGPVFVTIAQGELTYISSVGCSSRRYSAGTAFVDPGHGHVLSRPSIPGTQWLYSLPHSLRRRRVRHRSASRPTLRQVARFRPADKSRGINGGVTMTPPFQLRIICLDLALAAADAETK